MSKVKRIYFVMAEWCSHCRVSKEYVNKLKEELKAELITLNIDNKEEEKIADQIVKNYGDWKEDYLIPQVFIEINGKIIHILTGNPNGINYTMKAWEDFFKSEFYREIKEE